VLTRILPFRTLRGRLTLLASLTTLPAFLFVLYIAGNERADALRRAEREARYVAGLASREHAHQVAGAARLLETLAKRSTRELPPILPAILAGFPQVANLWIANSDGTIAYSVVAPPSAVAVRGNPVVSSAIESNDVAIGQYQLGPIVGRPVLLMGRRLETNQVLIAALELSWLDQLARQAGVPERTALVIADRSGHVLAGGSGTIDGFASLLAEPGQMREVRIDNVSRLAVATQLAGVPDVWVVAGPPRGDVYAAANRIFVRDAAVLALLAFFAVAASLIATDLSVLRDLRLLAGATRRFGRGDLTVRAPVPRPRGEIRELAVDFNTMAEALEQRQERLRGLSERLTVARDEESARIAQELHDRLGQELTVLKLELENLRRRAPESLLPSIDEMDRQINTAADSVRRISSELRPGVLDRLGLAAGLEWLLREFERHSDITTDIVADPSIGQVDPAVSTALFRITQEALTNITRHAGASLVELRLQRRDSGIELRLRDDGRGFDPESVRRKASLGLLGMEERARRLGGAMTIDSSLGAGTTLTVTIPSVPAGGRLAADAPRGEMS
jgi:signal transduction histidine kinase